jgi:hypothetical protein
MTEGASESGSTRAVTDTARGSKKGPIADMTEGANESVEPREAGTPGARRDHLSRPARLLGAWRGFARWATGMSAYTNSLRNDRPGSQLSSAVRPALRLCIKYNCLTH